jgi:RecA/RadA recombinase
MESKTHGGMSNLAAELDVTLQEAAGLYHEMQSCLFDQGRSFSSSNKNDDENDDENDNDATTRTISPIQLYHDYYQSGIVTAYDLLSRRDTRYKTKHIVTFCRQLDEILGGGIALGQVTEVAGLPSTGKTQLATQVSVLARLPRCFGGVQGQTLYVDTEGSFMPERAWDMAKALRGHIQNTASRKAQEVGHRRSNEQQAMAEEARKLSVEEILGSIQVFRVHDETALLATLYSLKQYIEKQQKKPDALPVKLIVIDSIAFHFRAVVPTDSSYYIQRTKTLTRLAGFLGDLASTYDLAVVAINQMTTKVTNSNDNSKKTTSNNGISMIVPSLGESWAHATATRLLLSKRERFVSSVGYGVKPDEEDDDEEDSNSQGQESIEDNNHPKLQQDRTCRLVKSSDRPSGMAHFRIVEAGIRDVTSSGQSGRNNKRHRKEQTVERQEGRPRR